MLLLPTTNILCMQTTRVLQSKHNACQLNKQQPFNAQACPFHQKENFSRLDANTPTDVAKNIAQKWLRGARSIAAARARKIRPKYEARRCPPCSQ